MGAVTLRMARPEDAALLEEWDREPAVIAAHGASPDENTDDGGFDWRAEIAAAPSWRRILVAEEDGRPVGVIVDIDPALEDTHYWGECETGLRAFDIWIGAASDRGRGVGAAMMRESLTLAFADAAVKAVIIDPLVANVRALRFYERCGFPAVEERWFDEDHCLVMRCDRPD